MNITYIVGNGFDLGLGLKTSYNDFIKEFIKTSSGPVSFDETSARALLRNKISEDKKSWSDAEMAFAGLDFTSMIPWSNKKAQILKLIAEFKGELDSYLKKEQCRFYPVNDLRQTSDAFKERIVKSLYEGYRGLHNSSTPELKLADKRENRYVNFINLNYTYTLDFLFRGNTEGSIEIPFVCNLDDGSRLDLNVGNIHHVHGLLTNDNTLFGVSSADQIKDPIARNLAEFSGILIKSRSDKEENGDHYAAALSDLRTSEVIVTFGVSFGESDKLWWRELASLVINKDVKIFIFPYSEKPSQEMNAIERTLIRAEWRNNLFSKIREELGTDNFTRLQDNMHKVVVLPFGPYTRHDGTTGYGDPWDLSYFASKVIRNGGV